MGPPDAACITSPGMLASRGVTGQKTAKSAGTRENLMAEEGKDGQGAAPAGGQPNQGATAAGGQPNLSVLAQYVKDLSFENPGAPAVLQKQGASPSINVAIGVQSQPMGSDQYEVELKIEARALDGDATYFVVELAFAGLFRLSNIPPENVQPVALIECPRLLFPFARQIISDCSRNGGFPPLLIDPVDFVALYRQRVAQQQAASAPPPGAQPS